MFNTQSPFSHLFNTNHPASEEEVSVIKGLISSPLNRLAFLNTEIDRLENERRNIQSFVDAHRVLISPFRRFPDEILSEVFVNCLPNDRAATRDTSEVPLVLGRICRRWRSVSLSTPRLWTSIHVVIPTKGNKDCILPLLERRSKGVEAWLARSGELPLTVSLYCNLANGDLGIYWSSGNDPPRHIITMFEIIVRAFTRWQKIQLSVSYMALDIFQRCMGLTWDSSDIPFLETFEVHATEAFYHQHTPFLSKFLEAPRMKTVVFLDICYYEDLPIANLTHLYIHDSYYVNTQDPFCLRILSQCPNLRSCALPPFQFNSAASELKTIFLPYLQNLSVKIEDIDYIRSTQSDSEHLQIQGHPFFNSISAPSLESLSVCFRSYRGNGCMNDIPFLSLLLPGHKVQRLNLMMRLSPSCFRRCLSLCPNLVELNLDLRKGWTYQSVHDDTRSMISQLTISPNEPSLCPSLKNLCIKITEPDPIVRDEALVELAYSRRRKNNSGLEKLLIDLPGRIKQMSELGGILNELRSEGMDVRFTFKDENAEDDHPAFGCPQKNLVEDTFWNASRSLFDFET